MLIDGVLFHVLYFGLKVRLDFIAESTIQIRHDVFPIARILLFLMHLLAIRGILILQPLSTYSLMKFDSLLVFILHPGLISNI